MMRIPIREQLALLILLASLIGLGVISIATWVANHSFVLSVCRSRLSLTASLKAAQLASNLDLMQTTSNLVSTRVIIQAALENYVNSGDNSAANWAQADQDMAAVIGSGGSVGQDLLLQSMVYPRNASGPAGPYSVLNTTSAQVQGVLELPWTCPNGSPATLGMSPSNCGGLDYGYPPVLYPNLTYTSATLDNGSNVQQATYNGATIGPGAREALLLGPWQINETFALVSITVPIVNTTSTLDVLGWLTVVMSGALISEIMGSSEGLQKTGETLLVGPVNSTNLFSPAILYSSNHGHPPSNFPVEYVIPLPTADANRHPNHTFTTPNLPFPVREYAAVQKGLTEATGNSDNSGAVVKGRNENGSKVAVGYAMPQTDLVEWLVIVELAQSEVYRPIYDLRNIILACVFGTAGFMAVIAFPLAHFAVRPIRSLREATAKSVEPPGQSGSRSSLGSFDYPEDRGLDDAEMVAGAGGAEKEFGEKPGDIPNGAVGKWRAKRHEERQRRRENRMKRAFRIPGKVPDRKHFVKDELSDLTRTFNEMSDELMMQYSRLEERVQERTAELELSKKAAEAANESKTLFIANISHELKTPLNGIMGMCAVCMQEDDPLRVKRSLGTIYKSGDLLLNLLTDLLTFSKNQVGQQLSLDEKEFRLRDISQQIEAIFEKQAREGHIDLRVKWEGVPFYVSNDSTPDFLDYGPNGTGRLKDMILWGDLQRILQVIINLVSNALKFTPRDGSVVLTIRCLPELADMSRRTSRASRQSPSRASRQSRQSRGVSGRHHGGSDASQVGSNFSTANAINARDRPHAMSQERAASPPPGVYLNFEFEVVDTGPGIPENLQQKIFEPFVQGDLRLTKKFGGTGLGLSICSQLASLMHGSIKVQSTVGVGSTFTLNMPLRHLTTRLDSSASSSVEAPRDEGLRRSLSFDDMDVGVARHSRSAGEELVDEKLTTTATVTTGSPAKVTSDSQPRLVGLSQPFFASSEPMESPGSQPAAMEKMKAEANRSGNKIRVLVAEDNKVNQEVVLRMLKLEDIYDVTVAKDGQEAVDYVKESMLPPTPDMPKECKPFDLIFMDVQMPNVDGLQSTRLIREIGYQAPIVALTAFAEESNIRDCIDSGMNYFL